MNSITMSITYRIEQFTVIINGSGTPDNLILTITVYVTHRNVVVSITIHCVTAFFSRRNGCSNLCRLIHISINDTVLCLGV